ncbi:Superfamily II DNA or RNA helicase [Raineyella antarctica]|uniref:Superfamily II DNA or RNA helicase n=1 Tax=Raineyella antarctica TaxID=1577474 RepID=A0A1G6H4G2_9ACTN|nr:Superfamily II DNA or RNA helicase [Raineyella antarctica]
MGPVSARLPEAPDLRSRGLSPAYPDRAAWGTVKNLRAWQAAALQQYREEEPRDFLTVATPGAGKTSFALTVAADLLNRRIVDRIIIITPTEHLKTQWAGAADRVGLPIDPEGTAKGGAAGKHYVGTALTYAGAAVNPNALRIRIEHHNTLVIFDEIHHAGDALSWGEAVREACEPARRRLALTGTPFRSDTNPIPFVTYEPDGEGTMRSHADYSYGYAEALADGIVRPVLFMAYSGDMHWRTNAGDEVSARLGEPMTKDMISQALRTALDPSGAWIPAVLRAADTRLTEVRQTVPDAGALVIANDQTSARAYARMLHNITGEKPTVVLSDEPKSGARITEFSESNDRWMVAVRMVSEGVDVPRLSVGVYATMTATPLFFAQAIGRFVRARSRGETATVFVPSVPRLLTFASELEVQRDHALKRRSEDETNLLAEALMERNSPDADLDGEKHQYQALGSEADFEKVLFDGGEFGLTTMAGSAEEQEYLGLPGLLDPTQVKDLLQRRQADQLARSEAQPARGMADDAGQERKQATHQRLRALRKELNSLVSAWNHRTDLPHGVIHNKLVSVTGGPPSAAADEETLEKRIELIRQWAISGSGPR